MTLVAMVVVFAAISYARGIVNPLLLALFFGIIFVQPIRWLISKKIPKWLSVLIVIMGFLGITIAFYEFLARSWSLFLADLPKYESNLEGILESALGFLGQIGVDTASLGESREVEPSKLVQYAGVFANKLVSLMSRYLTFLVFTIFLLAEFDSIRLKTEVLGRGTNLSIDYLRSMSDSIRHYLSIKTMTSLLTGVLIAIGLSLIGVDYPLLWGFMAFVLNYIPTIGSIIAALPALGFALLGLGYDGLILTGVLFLAVNILIGNGIEPKAMGRGMGLSTFVVFFSLIFWGFLLGPVGMFLSVPLTMVIKLITVRNPNTKWFAIILGTGKEALASLEESDK